MSTASPAAAITPQARKLDSAKLRQARVAGVILLGLAVLAAAVFAAGSEGTATFRLSRPTDPWALPNLQIPAAPFNYLVAAVLAFLGVRQFLRGGLRRTSVSLGIGLFLAVAAFLVWATAGKGFSLTGMLQATVVGAVPIALGGLAGVLSERVAVVNIAIEGMLLALSLIHISEPTRPY